jgi:Protein of unknown function (DUF2484)
MSLSIYLAVAWVFAATAVAMLPMRQQYLPGSVLLIAAPFLIGYLGYQFGWIAAIAALAAFVSMFRKPLRYYWRKWRGLETEVPE